MLFFNKLTVSKLMLIIIICLFVFRYILSGFCIAMDKSTNTSPLSKLAEIVVKKFKRLNKGQAYNIIINVRQINGGVLVGLSKSKFMEKVEQVVKEREEKNRQDAKRDENNKCRLKRTCPFCYIWFIEKFSRDRHIKICHNKSLKTKKSSC